MALKDYIDTTLYCEINKYCQQVLFERMKDGSLEKAPIHSDINTLFINPNIGVQMLCGGFPCTDISSIGLQKGINEETRSGLFLEIIRLLDETPSIKIVFLENVSNIVKCGMKEVVHELTKRGFAMCWTMKSASSLGAPHHRNRWFCMAIKGDRGAVQEILKSFDIENNNNNVYPDEKLVNFWSEEPTKRVMFRPSLCEDSVYDENWVYRSQTLGNSVVPLVVRDAFIDLVRIFRNMHSISDCFSDFKSSVNELAYPFPETGIIWNHFYYPLPKMPVKDVKNNVSITLGQGDNQLSMERYPTPRHGLTHPSTLTTRSIRDLPTVLVHCNESKSFIKDVIGKNNKIPTNLHTHILPNINYIEWMMGYPANWTKAETFVRHTTKKKTTEVYCDVGKDPERTSEVIVLQNAKKNYSKYNGMHMLMKEHKGKDIKYIANIWRTLSKIEKDKYTEAARSFSQSASDN